MPRSVTLRNVRDEPRFEASLCLPPDALHLLSSGTGTGKLSNWALLDSIAYMLPGVSNDTTARALTRDGSTAIQVTFLIADPPHRSYWCISCDCPDTQEEDDDDDDSPFFDRTPKIVASADHLALIEVGLTTYKPLQYFVYSAIDPSPTLVPLPDIDDELGRLREPYGLMPTHDIGSTHFILAALTYNYNQDDATQYDLHLFSSATSTWTRQPLSVDYGRARKPGRLYPTKVIALEDGLLGWVDLWEGVLVRAKGPTMARFVPMPRPLPNNQKLYPVDEARSLRDVTFDHGHIKCVEIEQLVRVKHKPAPVAHDPSVLLLLFDSQSPMVPEKDEYEAVGWRLITWFRALTWGHWQRGTILHSDEFGVVSWKDLQTCTPVLCDDNDNVVYLTSMLKKRRPQNETAWMVAVDTKTKSLPHQPMPFSANRSSPNYPNIIPCALTRYLMC
ncbi:hypothetical protein VPH35_047261 [Triticum aestivum]